MYSTPSCYLKALREAEDQDWPSKVGVSEQLDPTTHFGRPISGNRTNIKGPARS